MGDTAQTFEAGMTFDEYMADLRVHRDEFREHYERLAGIVGELRKDPPLNNARVLAIAEDWCPDCVFNVPILARFVEASSHAALRIVRRPECKSLADRYRGRGGGEPGADIRLPGRGGRCDWLLVGTLRVLARLVRWVYERSPDAAAGYPKRHPRAAAAELDEVADFFRAGSILWRSMA